jgi:hypothetical protein
VTEVRRVGGDLGGDHDVRVVGNGLGVVWLGAMLVATVPAGAAFLARERRVSVAGRSPVIELRLFAERGFWIASRPRSRYSWCPRYCSSPLRLRASGATSTCTPPLISGSIWSRMPVAGVGEHHFRPFRRALRRLTGPERSVGRHGAGQRRALAR